MKYTTYTRVSYYISVNYKTVEQTVLHRSIQKNNLDILKLLLDQPKLDVNFFATFTFNPGYIYFSFDNLKPKKTIVKKTALHLAYQANDQKIIQLLLNRKDIDINAQDDEGKKPNEVTKSKIFDQKSFPFKLISLEYNLRIVVISSKNIKKNQDLHLVCSVRTSFDSAVTYWDKNEQWNQSFSLNVYSPSETLIITVTKIEDYRGVDVATAEINLSSLILDVTTDKEYDLIPVNDNDNDKGGKIHLKLCLCKTKNIESKEELIDFINLLFNKFSSA